MRTICLEIQVEKPASAAAENFINMIQNNFGPRAIKISELIQETNQDEVCIRLKQAIKLNRLESNLKKDYNGVFKDLSVTGGGLILKGNRIFIPTSLRDPSDTEVSSRRSSGYNKNNKSAQKPCLVS